ncbi:RmlC-like cupin [Sphaerulina musiva SO2202]|uniref:RmlC-like cupin n=1 Tax=Sphaerulina musiva (strain SO2202) TaxID=692275 RepID=M3DEB9_SPHMS|nr:RmlC-like cupin [Sphaerulina musiva SO2202]EMF16140.1 RmlC-like cupin [Sphaerulina musiva SO2202]
MHQSNILSTILFSSLALAAPASHDSQSGYAGYGPPGNGSSSSGLSLIQQLELAPTAVDRIALLSPADFLYDFQNPPANTDAKTTGKGGFTVKADRKVFPALIGTGVAMTVGFLGPCGFNTPHIHPRSSEINIIIEGRLGTEFVAENGVPPIANILEKFQMTVFPKGAVHTEFNPDCTNATFVAGFGSEDPGVQQSAQTLFSLDPEIVKAVLDVETINGESIEQFRSMIPANVANGVDACLKKCGIPKRN